MTDRDIDKILKMVRQCGWYDANPRNRNHEDAYEEMDTETAQKALYNLLVEKLNGRSLRQTKRSDDVAQRPTSIALDHKEFTHWFNVRWFDDAATLKREARKSLAGNVKLDTIAYTCTWDNKDSIEQGEVDCCGEIYLLKDATAGVIAHEAVHMALGILNREGEENLPITADNAPEVEEELGSLVAFITDEILTLRQSPAHTLEVLNQLFNIDGSK